MRKNKGLWRIKRGAAHGPSGRSKEHALFCCWPKGPRFQKRLAKRVVDAGLPRSGSSGLLMSDSKACLIYPEPADRRFFPPLVVAYLVKLACQMPDQAGRSLSLWFCAELAQELERRKIVETISAQSVQRMLASHKLKPWRVHHWLGQKGWDTPAFRERTEDICHWYTCSLLTKSS